MKRGELRQLAMERAGFTCEFDGCHATGGVLEMAHLKGSGSGGSRFRDDPDNVAIFCQHHHDWLDGRTTAQRRFDNEIAVRGMLGRQWKERR